MKYIIDTNVLMDFPNVIDKYDVIILSHVIRELENHKNSRNYNLAYKSRKAIKYIKNNLDKITFDDKDYNFILNDIYDPNYTDNRILQACVENNYGLITNDLLLQFKAKQYNLDIIDCHKKNTISYSGVKDIFIDKSNIEDQKILVNIYENPHINTFNLFQNQYLIIWDKITNHAIDKFRWDGYKLVKLKYKPIRNDFAGKIIPINYKQELVFDLLQNPDITVKSVFGNYGVGKDFLMISHALNLIANGRFEKLIWVRNNIEVKDTNQIGFLPSDLTSKLLPFAMPLADHLGGIYSLEMMIKENKIEVQHLGFMRGREIKNSIIYVTEVQNNTKDHVELLIGRVGHGSNLWVNGDVNQSDEEKFFINSSIEALTKLKGNKLYGQVTLDKIERSETSKLAEILR